MKYYKLLGKGQFGEVYMARYREDFVAVKKLACDKVYQEFGYGDWESFMKDILGEVEVMHGLQHESIVGVVGVAVD